MFNKTRTLFAMMMMAGAATMFVSADAYAAKDDPHQEEQDGCDHGATGKECREDPSEKGKDCDEHGKHGGVNEDHCTTTTTVPEVTVTTVPEVTATTVPGAVVPSPVAPADEEAPVTAAPAADELPATGASTEALAAFAGALMIFGTGLRKFVTS